MLTGNSGNPRYQTLTDWFDFDFFEHPYCFTSELLRLQSSTQLDHRLLRCRLPKIAANLEFWS